MDGTLPPAARSFPRPGRLVAFLTAGLAAAMGVLAWAVARELSSEPTGVDPAAMIQARFEDETGLRVVRVALSGGGGLVDLRYRVVDAHKAHGMHGEPYALVDEATGRVVDALFMGHKHGGRPEAGHTYPLLFVNEHGLLEPGEAVTVVLGGSRLEHVLVR